MARGRKSKRKKGGQTKRRRRKQSPDGLAVWLLRSAVLRVRAYPICRRDHLRPVICVVLVGGQVHDVGNQPGEGQVSLPTERRVAVRPDLPAHHPQHFLLLVGGAQPRPWHNRMMAAQPRSRSTHGPASTHTAPLRPSRQQPQRSWIVRRRGCCGWTRRRRR